MSNFKLLSLINFIYYKHDLEEYPVGSMLNMTVTNHTTHIIYKVKGKSSY